MWFRCERIWIEQGNLRAWNEENRNRNESFENKTDCILNNCWIININTIRLGSIRGRRKQRNNQNTLALTCSGRWQEMVADGRSSSALPKYRQFVGISTEFSYIRPHPFECLSLVFQSEVAGKYHVSRTCETKKSQPIIQRHENHILFQKPLGEGEIVGTISRYESTAMYGNSDSSPGVSFKL